MPHGKPMHNFQLKRGYRANYACVDCGVEMIGDPRAQEPCRNSSAISIEAHAPATPATQTAKEVLCGSAKNADTSMNTAIRPTADNVYSSEGLLLPDEEWNNLSKDSQGKIKKWFELAVERLQLILDEPVAEAAPTTPPADIMQLATRLAMMNGQVAGGKSNYFVTLEQLDEILRAGQGRKP